MRIRPCVILLVGLALTACSSGSSSPAPTTAAAPTEVQPTLGLVSATLLHVHFLRPAGWTGGPVGKNSGAGSADVTYVAPGRRGTLYVEQNDCAACVDQGLVQHGHRNGTPDPGNAVASYFPKSQHRVDANTVTFTVAATKPYIGSGKLVVTRSQGSLTGYVVVIVTLPDTQSADAQRILASVRVT